MLLSMKDSFFTCQPVNKSAIDSVVHKSDHKRPGSVVADEV